MAYFSCLWNSLFVALRMATAHRIRDAWSAVYFALVYQEDEGMKTWAGSIWFINVCSDNALIMWSLRYHTVCMRNRNLNFIRATFVEHSIRSIRGAHIGFIRNEVHISCNVANRHLCGLKFLVQFPPPFRTANICRIILHTHKIVCCAEIKLIW